MLKVKLLNENAKPPQRATTGSAGYDLCACISEPILIKHGEIKKIPTGIAIEIAENTAAFVYGRSGLGIKYGISPANAVGVIDSDYRGEIVVGLINHGESDYEIQSGDRIAQLVIMPVLTPEIELCTELQNTARGEGGFGSTGKV